MKRVCMYFVTPCVCVCVCVCVCARARAVFFMFSVDRANRLINEKTSVVAGKAKMQHAF